MADIEQLPVFITIAFTQGDDFDITLWVYEDMDQTQPLDLSEATIKIDVNDAEGALVQAFSTSSGITIGSTTDPETLITVDTIEWSISNNSATATALIDTPLFYDIEIEISGKKLTYVNGTITLGKQETKS